MRGTHMQRLEQLRHWVETALKAAPLMLEPASADASFRRYFRIRTASRSFIVMDAPPAHVDCRPFVRIARLMAESGVHVPAVLAQDLEHGFLLLSDLGTTSYLKAFDCANADLLFEDAIDTLLRWQIASRPGVLPAYDETLLRRELALFPEWYV